MKKLLAITFLYIGLFISCKHPTEEITPTEKVISKPIQIDTSQWLKLAPPISEYSEEILDMKKPLWDTSSYLFLTNMYYYSTDKNFKKTNTYKLINRGYQFNYRSKFTQEGDIIYTIYPYDIMYADKKSVVVSHSPYRNETLTNIYSIQSFTGDSSPNCLYASAANDIDYTVYSVYNKDSGNTYAVVFQYGFGQNYHRTRLDIEVSKELCLFQKIPNSDYLMMQYGYKLYMIGTNKRVYTFDNDINNILIGRTNTAYLFYDKSSHKLQETNFGIQWNSLYTEYTILSALQSFDKKHLILFLPKTQELKNNNTYDIIVINLANDERYRITNDENFGISNFWVQNNIIYIMNSSGFYARLLK